MDLLPDEIMISIFEYCSGYDLVTSFQTVCTRWNNLINETESIWKGNVKLKGITERQCKTKLVAVLKSAPKLKYLQIGSPHLNVLAETETEEEKQFSYDDTRDVLATVTNYNKDIEYLHVIDRFPFSDSIRTIIERPKFKRLSVTLDKLCQRREKINHLKKLFAHLPNVIDSKYIDFCQKIQFHFEKCEKDVARWEITQDCAPDQFR